MLPSISQQSANLLDYLMYLVPEDCIFCSNPYIYIDSGGSLKTVDKFKVVSGATALNWWDFLFLRKRLAC